MKSTVLRAGLGLAIMVAAISGAVVSSCTSAQTIRIAEHRQARIDALNKSIPSIEKQLGITIEVVEYPAHEKDYMSKLLT
jgi:multiple sugar transport system substrate-binding protein